MEQKKLPIKSKCYNKITFNPLAHTEGSEMPTNIRQKFFI